MKLDWIQLVDPSYNLQYYSCILKSLKLDIIVYLYPNFGHILLQIQPKQWTTSVFSICSTPYDQI